MIYLNDQMTGGQTQFFSGMDEAFRGFPYLSVRPKEGMALVFVHRIWHEGAVVESGEICTANRCNVRTTREGLVIGLFAG